MFRERGGHARRTLLLGSLLAFLAGGGFAALAAWNDHLHAGGTRFLSLATSVDAWIPLRPAWVWPYLSYYLLCLTPLRLIDRWDTTVRILRAFALQFGVAFLCFLAFPIRMEQPGIVGDSLSATALRWVYSIDHGYNIFPSLHVANACMVALAFHRFRRGPWVLPIAVWAGLVSLSTVVVKQHYAVDVVAGVLLGVIADRVALRAPAPAVPPGLPGAADAGH